MLRFTLVAFCLVLLARVFLLLFFFSLLPPSLLPCPFLQDGGSRVAQGEAPSHSSKSALHYLLFCLRPGEPQEGANGQQGRRQVVHRVLHRGAVVAASRQGLAGEGAPVELSELTRAGGKRERTAACLED